MYITTRNIAGGTFMTCGDCGHAISMNKICKTPLQSATDMLKHMAAHNASRSFAAVGCTMRPEPEAVSSSESALVLSAFHDQWIAPISPSPN
jgi:hypothetical protein